MFTDDIYRSMLDNDEMWYVCDGGIGCIILDLPLFDA